MLSGEGSTFFNNDNSANFSGDKKYNKEFRGVYFLTMREKTLNQISNSWSFSSSNLKVSINISLRAGSSPFRGVARSRARVAREGRRECERLCRLLARSLAVGFAHHIKINGEVARRLHLHGQAGGYTVRPMVRKIGTGERRPRIGLTICTNQFHLPKNGCKSLKLVSNMALEKWNKNFHSPANRTTFSDISIPSPSPFYPV